MTNDPTPLTTVIIDPSWWDVDEADTDPYDELVRNPDDEDHD